MVPYNQLQRLRINLSGREIGVVQFSPYTYGTDSANIQVSVNGQFFPAVVESGSLRISLTSGSQVGSIKESGALSISISGGQIGQPNDVQTFNLRPSGFIYGNPFDNQLLTFSATGNLDRGVDDVFSKFGIERITGNFDSVVRESGNLGVSIKSGNVQGNRKDSSSMTFLFLTGSYSSGLFTPPFVATNYPQTGVDSYAMSFIMFSGSYAGGA